MNLPDNLRGPGDNEGPWKRLTLGFRRTCFQISSFPLSVACLSAHLSDPAYLSKHYNTFPMELF